MKTNFRKFLALALAMLMVVSTFSSLAVFAEQNDCNHLRLDGSSAWEDVTTVEADCTKRGYTLRECALCRKVEAYNFQDMGDHVYPVEPDEYVAPECAHRKDPKPGKKVWYCDVCGYAIGFCRSIFMASNVLEYACFVLLFSVRY